MRICPFFVMHFSGNLASRPAVAMLIGDWGKLSDPKYESAVIRQLLNQLKLSAEILSLSL
jgi:hypothetical protein